MATIFVAFLSNARSARCLVRCHSVVWANNKRHYFSLLSAAAAPCVPHLVGPNFLRSGGGRSLFSLQISLKLEQPTLSSSNSIHSNFLFSKKKNYANDFHSDKNSNFCKISSYANDGQNSNFFLKIAPTWGGRPKDFFSISSSGGCCVTGRTRGPSSGRGVVARNNSFGTDGNGRVGSRYYVAICHIIQRLLRNQHDDDSKSVDNLFLFNFRYKSHRRDLSRLNGSITSRDKRPMACFHTSHVVSDLSPTNFILTRIEMLLKIASTLNSRWHQTAAKRNAIPPLLSGGTMNECRKRKKPKRAGWKDCKFLLRLPLLFRW